MNKILLDLLALICGAALSLFYFGGLLLQLKYLARAKYSVFLLLGSFFIRIIIICISIYYVLRLLPLRQIFIFFAGFFLIKFILVLYQLSKKKRVKNGD